jgi:replication-associated recombination protein RarA
MSDLFSAVADSQPSIAFPAALTERYRPRTVSEFIGLDKPKRLAAKLAAQPFESAWLFLGPSGTGKTTLALAIAEMMPAELHHIPSQECNLENIERVRATCQYVPRSGCRMHLVLADEADQMSHAAQVSLLSKLDATNFPPNTIFIFTANATDRLEPRFLSRLRTVDFSSYGIASDAAALLQSIWEREAPADAKAPNFARIVKDANNNVREALMKLETELLLA